MPGFRPLRCLVLPVVAAALLPVGAEAAPSLAEAIKQADAKYLKLKDLDAKPATPNIEAGSGEEETKPTSREIVLGPLKAALSYRQEGSGEEATTIPVVTLFADGKQIVELKGEGTGTGDPPVSVQIAEIDPGNSSPEIVVSFYTGGAHCCSDTKVISASKDGASWKTIEVGQFDGGPLLANDLAGDGHPVFETRDNAFLYAFGCYACSTAPLKILTIEDGEVKNVSAEPRFRRAHESYLKGMIAEVPDEEVNGFLAGYVGEKILLGDGKQAWTLMLDHYDKASDWGLDVCDQPLDPDGNCPGKTERLAFPAALERMLNENGYKIEK
jgi:hypothetical protein